MEISIEISTDVRARGSNSQPSDPEFDALDRSATDPRKVKHQKAKHREGNTSECQT